MKNIAFILMVLLLVGTATAISYEGKMIKSSPIKVIKPIMVKKVPINIDNLYKVRNDGRIPILWI